MGEWWDALQQAIGGAGSSLSDLWGSASQTAGQIGGGIADFGGNLWNSAMQNPWQALGVGVQGASQFAPYLMNQSGAQGGNMGMDVGAWAQMQQPGGPTPQQLRRNIGDVQARGLSGASPDFMAAMSGVTPQELDQMLGYRSSGVGAT